MNTFTPGTKIECPCCGKGVKVTKTGALANHGYVGRAGNNYSWLRDGACRASGATSREDALEARRSIYRDMIAATEKEIAAGKQVGLNTSRLAALRVDLAAV
jgi:hypothetical protein